MDRIPVYPGALVQETDSLGTQRNAMVNDGAVVSAFLDIGTWLSRLYASPTNPPSMSVIVGDGTVYSWTTVDSSAFSSLPMDARGNFKVGVNLDPTVLPLTAPTTPGYSINYLVAGCLSETDGGSRVLPYFNAANPAQPYMGPLGSGAAQFTERNQRVGIELISGVASPAGSQNTPPAPVGWVPMYVITVNAGATSVAQGDIAVAPGAPFLRTKLNSMASGAELAAAIADFVTHGQLNAAVAPLAPLASPALSGTPTVPTAADGDSSAQIANTFFVRETANEIANAYAQSVRFPEAGISFPVGQTVWTVPPGVTRFRGKAVGGGAGGCGCDGSQAGAGGGAGGTAEGWVAVSPGQQILMTVGAGGASGYLSGGSGAGGTSRSAPIWLPRAAVLLAFSRVAGAEWDTAATSTSLAAAALIVAPFLPNSAGRVARAPWAAVDEQPTTIAARQSMARRQARAEAVVTAPRLPDTAARVRRAA